MLIVPHPHPMQVSQVSLMERQHHLLDQCTIQVPRIQKIQQAGHLCLCHRCQHQHTMVVVVAFHIQRMGALVGLERVKEGDGVLQGGVDAVFDAKNKGTSLVIVPIDKEGSNRHRGDSNLSAELENRTNSKETINWDNDYANYAIYKLCLTRWLQDRIDTFLYILLKANAMLCNTNSSTHFTHNINHINPDKQANRNQMRHITILVSTLTSLRCLR